MFLHTMCCSCIVKLIFLISNYRGHKLSLSPLGISALDEYSRCFLYSLPARLIYIFHVDLYIYIHICIFNKIHKYLHIIILRRGNLITCRANVNAKIKYIIHNITTLFHDLGSWVIDGPAS